MNKSNLALLADKCIKGDLISKVRRPDDRRTLSYALTEKGREELEKRLDEIEKKFTTVLTDEKEKQTAQDNLDTAVELLSYL